uniref:Uncharacterized protein n=1 Tax=Terrapene triunguis TaxID=2587831 RepID=A0A674I6X8_9SAUR
DSALCPWDSMSCGHLSHSLGYHYCPLCRQEPIAHTYIALQGTWPGSLARWCCWPCTHILQRRTLGRGCAPLCAHPGSSRKGRQSERRGTEPLRNASFKTGSPKPYNHRILSPFPAPFCLTRYWALPTGKLHALVAVCATACCDYNSKCSKLPAKQTYNRKPHRNSEP